MPHAVQIGRVASALSASSVHEGIELSLESGKETALLMVVGESDGGGGELTSTQAGAPQVGRRPDPTLLNSLHTTVYHPSDLNKAEMDSLIVSNVMLRLTHCASA